jgi:hypothetical protein
LITAVMQWQTLIIKKAGDMASLLTHPPKPQRMYLKSCTPGYWPDATAMTSGVPNNPAKNTTAMKTATAITAVFQTER